MSDKIVLILQDLYKIDSSLRSHEKELVEIINNILLAKPETDFDEEFYKGLRATILERAQKMESEKKSGSWFFWINFLKSKTFLTVGAAAVLVLIIWPFTHINLSKNNSESILAPKVAIFNKGDFGALTSGTGSAESATGRASNSFAPSGLGGGAVGATPTSDTNMKIAMPPYGGYSSYHYIYRGEDMVLNQAKLAVLKRQKWIKDGSDVLGLLGRFSFNLTDLSMFKNSKLQNFNLIQEDDYGYLINVNLTDSIISAYQNWPVWPKNICSDNACYEASKLKLADMPQDDEILAVASAFVKDHKISLTGYGEPVVQNDWRLAYETTEDKGQYYFPESLTVIYPVKVSGRNVLEQDGSTPVGIWLSVSIKEKKVVGFNLSVQRYDSAEYVAETDWQKMKKIIEAGGLYNWQYPADDNSPLVIELGTPTVEYIRHFRYNEKDSDELLVPALVFPVIKKPESGYFAKKSIVVPLITEILEGNSDGPVRILMESYY